MTDHARKRDKFKALILPRRPPSKSRPSKHEASTLSSTASSSGPRDDTVEPNKSRHTGHLSPSPGEASEPSITTTERVADQLTTSSVIPVPAVTRSPTEDKCRNEPPAGSVAELESSSSNLWYKALAKLAQNDQDFIKEVRSDAAVESLFGALYTSIQEKQRDGQLRRQPISAFGRNFCVRDIMVKIVDCIQRFKEIGDVAVSFDPVHAALPWAAFRFLLQLVTATAEQTGLLLILLERIGPLVLRGEIYERIYLQPLAKTESDVRTALERALVNLYTAVLSAMTAAARLFGKGTIRQKMHAVAYPDEIKSLLDKLEEKTLELGAEAQACEGSLVELMHRETSREFRRLRGILDKPLARIDNQLERMWTKVASSERGAMLEWMSPVPYESDHEFARRDRLEVSGEWLLEREEYREWRDSSSSTIFWLHGIRKSLYNATTSFIDKLHEAGAGKTKLASKVVDDFLSISHKSKTDDGLAYFYCVHNGTVRDDLDTILQSLVRQLSAGLRDNTKVVQAIHDIYADQRAKGRPTTHPLAEKCIELLPALLAAYTQVIIVVDGLDECEPDTRQSLTSALATIIDMPACLVKIFVASRNDTDLIRRYGGGRHLLVEAAHNQRDIENFVAAKMARTTKPLFRDKMSEKTKRLIRDTFREKSQGMFQWAKVQIDELLALRIESDVIAYLNELPEGLTRAYDNLIDKILEQKGKTPLIAIRAFLWIMASPVALTPDELVSAVQQNPDTEGAEPEITDVDFDVVLDACHNLITITGQEDKQVCRFSHLSVQEYLELHLEKRIRRHPQLPDRSAKTHIGMVCLRVLTDTRFLPDGDGMHGTSYVQNLKTAFSEVLTDEDWFALAQHCDPELYLQGVKATGLFRIMDHRDWSAHVRDSNPKSPAEVDERAPLLRRFLGGPQVSSRFYRHWVLSDAVKGRGSNPDVTSLNVDFVSQSIECPSFGMAFFGLLGALESWADQIDFSVKGKRGINLLHLAAQQGHREVCELLLKEKARVNVRDEEGNTPLSLAVQLEHVSVAELLLEKGQADPDLDRNCDVASPLVLSIEQGESALTSLLLDKGADPDAGAVYAAIVAGETDLLQRLLDLGAHARPESIMDCMEGSDENMIEIARILIDREHLDINYVDRSDTHAITALSQAIWLWLIEMAEFLIDHGADVNRAVGWCGTPLQCAARCGRAEVVPLLLSKGADPDCVDDIYPLSPLYIAYQELVKLRRSDEYLRTKDYRDVVGLLETAGANLLSSSDQNSKNEAEHLGILELREQYTSRGWEDDKT